MIKIICIYKSYFFTFANINPDIPAPINENTRPEYARPFSFLDKSDLKISSKLGELYLDKATETKINAISKTTYPIAAIPKFFLFGIIFSLFLYTNQERKAIAAKVIINPITLTGIISLLKPNASCSELDGAFAKIMIFYASL
ncbi:Hypothetical protein, predicted transmembrane protein [Mycoplasma mycoides subsp. capri PG3]|nr:Hypothetical protein, predicted transmembrane protein [Mycoplasma mycoides subsp. capri PG3]